MGTAELDDDDRRRHLRMSPTHEDPIRVNIDGDHFVDIFDATDISESGLGLKAPQGFRGCDLNKQVSFIIELPSRPKNIFLQARGKIIHIYGSRFGISFDDLSDITRAQIKRYIAGRLRQESFFDWFKYRVGMLE